MTKIVTFDTNGQPLLRLLKGETSQVYFTFTYSNSPELFYHSYNAALVPKVRMPNKTGGFIEFALQIISYFPCCLYLSLDESQKVDLAEGDGLEMEVDLWDVSNVKHLAQRGGSLFVQKKLFP